MGMMNWVQLLKCEDWQLFSNFVKVSLGFGLLVRKKTGHLGLEEIVMSISVCLAFCRLNNCLIKKNNKIIINSLIYKENNSSTPVAAHRSQMLPVGLLLSEYPQTSSGPFVLHGQHRWSLACHCCSG